VLQLLTGSSAIGLRRCSLPPLRNALGVHPQNLGVGGVLILKKCAAQAFGTCSTSAIKQLRLMTFVYLLNWYTGRLKNE